MPWSAVAIYGVLGLLLGGMPRLFFRSSCDAGRDARLEGGLQHFGAVFLHLAALIAFLKLAGALCDVPPG